MEKKLTVSNVLNETQAKLFSTIEKGECVQAKAMIGENPSCCNAIKSLGDGKHATTLAHAILYAAKKGVGSHNEKIANELLNLFAYVISRDEFNILCLDSRSNTLLHHAIWYEYPEVVELILSQAKKRQGAIKTLFSAVNVAAETPLRLLLKMTITSQAQFEKIRDLLLNAMKDERQRAINQENFLKTAPQLIKQFHDTLCEDILTDSIDFTSLRNPIILPEGQTFDSSFFTDLSNKRPNINPFTSASFKNNQKVPHLLVQKLLDVLPKNETEDELQDFYMRVDSLLYGPWDKEMFENPFVVAEEKQIILEDGSDAYGHTINKHFIDDNKINSTIYPDLLIKSVCELKKQFDAKLNELASASQVSSENQAHVVVMPDDLLNNDGNEMPSTLSKTKDSSVLSIVRETTNSDGDVVQVIDIFCESDLTEKIEHSVFEANKEADRFNGVSYEVDPSDTKIQIKFIKSSDSGKILINRLLEMGVLELNQIESCKTIETQSQPIPFEPGLPLRDENSKNIIKVSASPAVTPSIFSSIESNSSKKTLPVVYPKSISANSHVVKKIFSSDVNEKLEYLVIEYRNNDDACIIKNALCEHAGFCNPEVDGKSILIKMNSENSMKKPGFFVWGDNTLCIMFPNSTVKDSFMEIMSIKESFIRETVNFGGNISLRMQIAAFGLAVPSVREWKLF